ncbi:MAG: hypothetical protein A3E80_05890 [Chlamydiae bacterium RIFCSPHIGHO2_12_FULL_49_9]|nr:MAG: hypothetical protein A3E80_05890 [Chlamydiae bacterium RIFCSPHIGHO2_12_FULL_49_9]
MKRSIFKVAFGVSVFFFGAMQAEAHEMDQHFATVQKHVENRWRDFQANREFKLFEPGKSDAVLKEEFADILKTRASVWETHGYEFAQHLVDNDLIRAPGCGAFSYNNTAHYYNASTIYLGDLPYVACEGPRSKDVPKFFNLLRNSQVTHLVRLTDSHEGETKKCHPYWDGLLSEAGYLNIPAEPGDHSVRAFDMAYWKDNQGIDPDQLLAVVLKVREELANSGGLLAVHCSAGVGRTGTFFASLAIVDAIDRGGPFSIEEIVYRLSLQRVNSVGHPNQYVTLHRLAESYLKQSPKDLHVSR